MRKILKPLDEDKRVKFEAMHSAVIAEADRLEEELNTRVECIYLLSSTLNKICEAVDSAPDSVSVNAYDESYLEPSVQICALVGGVLLKLRGLGTPASIYVYPRNSVYPNTFDLKTQFDEVVEALKRHIEEVRVAMLQAKATDEVEK